MPRPFTISDLENGNYPWHEVLEAKPVCPNCGGHIPNNDTPGLYPGALSRKDNETEICSACGVGEAMDDYIKGDETQ